MKKMERLAILRIDRNKVKKSLEGGLDGMFRSLLVERLEAIDAKIRELESMDEADEGLAKYPRTPHLPWSEGVGENDRVAVDEYMRGKEVIVTIKMDGENTTMYRNNIHARSLNSKSHPSRDWVKGLHAGIADLIPNGMRICGENLFAKHSIHYQHLPSYFLVHSVWWKNPSRPSGHDMCLSWDETEGLAHGLGLQTVPVLYRGPYDTQKIKALYSPQTESGDEMEGYVVRHTGPFTRKNFHRYVGKFVRKNHVQTDEHWMHQEMIRNKLK
jgi:hypothetical protein